MTSIQEFVFQVAPSRRFLKEGREETCGWVKLIIIRGVIRKMNYITLMQQTNVYQPIMFITGIFFLY